MDWSWLTYTLLFLYLLKRVWDVYNRTRTVQRPVVQRNLTQESLILYDGRDPFKALLISVKGKIYDVSVDSSVYGPGGELHVHAGKECARALGKKSTEAEECNDDIKDFNESEVEVLNEWIGKLDSKYPVYGKVVAPISLSLKDLREYDGSDPAKPMYMAIKGTIFDVSKAPQFYGPDGMYPFAGYECARALALQSTEIEDCNGNLEGLDVMDMDNLSGWYAKFVSKYDIVGKVA